MTPLQLRLIFAGVIVLVAFIAGWEVKGAFVAKEQLSIEKAKDEFIKAYQASESMKALVLEEKLSELKANEKTIERERIKVIDRPVYSNECLDADGLQLVERARRGKADTSQPTDKVSGAN